ncbi:hypothetical protein M426DRAFT_11954 [Hypoxylon sp. CI-4A]|nr:hypothetical protein M426DRAFT_11954 [Hypoxylon sp. CI-4A]
MDTHDVEADETALVKGVRDMMIRIERGMPHVKQSLSNIERNMAVVRDDLESTQQNPPAHNGITLRQRQRKAEARTKAVVKDLELAEDNATLAGERVDELEVRMAHEVKFKNYYRRALTLVILIIVIYNWNPVWDRIMRLFRQ